MTLRKLIVLATIASIAGVVASGAFARHDAATATTAIRAITKPLVMVPNRYVQDNLRWDKDVYAVPSGGTIRVVNLAAGEGPHTFTVVRKSDRPRNGRQAVNCRICNVLAKAHGADPNSDAPPKFPFLEDGVGQATPPSVDKPGDSGITGKGKRGESITLTLTAPSGTKLYFMCLIHPWMQAELDVS
jgi:uncharacterized cupredoxin-like copper-binding protein